MDRKSVPKPLLEVFNLPFSLDFHVSSLLANAKQKKKKPSNVVRYLSGRCPILPATEGRKRRNASKLLRDSKTNLLELHRGRNPLTMQTEERRQSSPHRRASCRQKQRGPRTLDRPDGQAFRTQTIALEVSRNSQFYGGHCGQQRII